MFPPVLFPGLVRPAVDQQLQAANAEGKKETNLEGDSEEKDTSADENSPDDLANSSGIMDGSLTYIVCACYCCFCEFFCAYYLFVHTV